MKQIFPFFIVVWLLCLHTISADPIISFFFREYSTQQCAEALLSKFKKPNAIAKQTMNGFLHCNSVAGIFSSYFGFINVSDYNGQTVFPRKQSKAILDLIITNKITPIIMFQNTVHHWELVPGVPAAMYRLELKEDPDTKLFFWESQKIALPADNQIPVQESLIIIAKPQDIIVPAGITVSQPSANLILPEMYVKRSIQTTRNALYVLNISFLFRPIDLLYKKAKTNYETLINE